MSWVMFDYGGVLCQPQPDQDLARLARAAGCSWPRLHEAYWAHRLAYDRGDLDRASFWQKVGAEAGRSLSGGQVAELARLDTESWLHLQPETVALVEELAAAGHHLALLSNAPADVAVAVAALPVAAHFDHLAFSCFLRSAKPDPGCYRMVLERLGAGADEVVFLDDRPENVAAATALGIRGVRFTGVAGARLALARYDIALG